MLNTPLLFDLLCCPACQGGLSLKAAGTPEPDGHILSGSLQCERCQAAYPIEGGVPRFLPQRLGLETAETVQGFGYQWQTYNAVANTPFFSSAEIFLDFIEPIGPEHFAGKKVLDAGCGQGRFTRLAQGFGAAAVVGVDLSEAVNAAFANTRHLPNVLIVQADIFALPLRTRFDYAFSVGVLHHTRDPQAAFRAVVRCVRPGGTVSAWVYGLEGNGWIVRWLNPIRRTVTSRLPRALLVALSALVTLPVFVISKGVYLPVGKYEVFAPLRKRLFYFNYLSFMARFSFSEQQLQVFDHLSPTLAEYIARNDFEKWFEEARLQQVVISSRNGNSWRGLGSLPADPAPEGS